MRPLSLALLATLAACVEHPTEPSRPAPAPSAPGPTTSPLAIGHRPDAAPEREPIRVAPPRPLPSIPFAPPAALAPLPSGGALLAWAGRDPAAGGHPTIAFRALDGAGTLGPAYAASSARGNLRDISIATRGDEALIAWIADFGGVSAQINAQRARPDGSLVGPRVTIGSFRVNTPTPDGGIADALGFAVRAGATGDRYVIALRGPGLECDGAPCPSIRVVQITPDNALEPRGGIQHPGLTAPLLLLAPGGAAAWSVAVGLGGASAPPAFTTLGSGPLERLPHPAGAALVAAWTSGGAPRAIVRRPAEGRGRAESFEIVGLEPSGAGASGARRIDRVRMVCAGGVAAVELAAGRETVVVPVTDPGADVLALWAMSRMPARAPRGGEAPLALAWVTNGLVVARPAGLELARCAGNALGAPAPIAW
jgi:hypothetical protein